MMRLSEVHFIQTSDVTYLPLLQQTSKTVLEYCERKGFSYESYVGIMRGYFPWHAVYNRILMLERIKKSGYKGWVFYVDADAFVFDLNFDLAEFLSDKDDIAFIAARGGPEGGWWNVNAGVFLVNLGHSIGVEIVDDWCTRFSAISDSDLAKAEQWSSVTDDQSLLWQTLDFVKGAEGASLVLREPHLINYDGTFVRQILRVAGTFDERVRRTRLAVQHVLETNSVPSELNEIHKDFATACYRTLLLREPDSEGLASAIKSLGHGLTLNDSLASCLRSNEFRQKFQSFRERYGLP